MAVLVGYASEHGSTREIAERIGDRLSGHGLSGHGLGVEVVALNRVTDPARYDALILGSAIHNRAWLPDATRFVQHSAAVLSERPVWLYSVGMPAALRRPLRHLARSEGAEVVAGFRDLLAPRGQRLFSGVYRREHNTSAAGRLLFAVVARGYGDFRNWDEIDAWADEIAAQLEASSREVSRAGR